MLIFRSKRNNPRQQRLILLLEEKAARIELAFIVIMSTYLRLSYAHIFGSEFWSKLRIFCTHHLRAGREIFDVPSWIITWQRCGLANGVYQSSNRILYDLCLWTSFLQIMTQSVHLSQKKIDISFRYGSTGDDISEEVGSSIVWLVANH